MGIKKLVKKSLLFGILTLFIVSTSSTMIIGYKSNGVVDVRTDELLDYLAFHCYDESCGSAKFDYYKEQILKYCSNDALDAVEDVVQLGKSISTTLSGGPMDSPWPMKSHDVYHTGRSVYSTFNNSGYEKWRFRSGLWGDIESSAAIDDNGTIYFGTLDSAYSNFFALHPNGTEKWNYKTGGLIWSTPAIAEDGTIYVGSYDAKLHAIYPNGTRKWKCSVGVCSSSPAIGADGTIYLGNMGNKIVAVNPNGTKKWTYETGYKIVSDPAIGQDGTIYIGSGDTYLYAMNPNGTLKWRFKTKDIIKGHPSIAKDGTIYISSWDDYLYALYPNGTMRWKRKTGYGTNGGPAIGEDGTIYIMTNKLRAIYPNNGTVKWILDIGGSEGHSSPAISSDGTIYTCTDEGKHLVAVNPDGTEKWRRKISNLWADSSPIIGEDGTIYVGSSWEDEHTHDWYGFLFAFGTGGMVVVDAHGPYYGLINVPIEFFGHVDFGYPPYSWLWDFGDGDTSEERNPLHTYTNPGNYSITLTVTDDSGNTSYDTTWAWIQTSNDPPDIPNIDGPIHGEWKQTYNYTFMTNDPEGLKVRYYIDWGDTTHTGWIGPYLSGEEIIESHSWWKRDSFIIRCKARDPYNAESEWGELKIWMPKKNIFNFNFNLLDWIFEWFSNIFSILRIQGL